MGPVDCIERFDSRDQRPYWFAKTKDDFCIKIKFNFRRNGLVHQYGCRDVICKRSFQQSVVDSLQIQVNETYLPSLSYQICCKPRLDALTSLVFAKKDSHPLFSFDILIGQFSFKWPCSSSHTVNLVPTAVIYRIVYIWVSLGVGVD